MRKLVCLFAILSAFVAVGCSDDAEEAAAKCSPMGQALNCSALETCCTDSSSCWYNATKGGTTKKFSCNASDCQSAAADAVAFCQ